MRWGEKVNSEAVCWQRVAVWHGHLKQCAFGVAPRTAQGLQERTVWIRNSGRPLRSYASRCWCSCWCGDEFSGSV